jgi:hypothetical protein
VCIPEQKAFSTSAITVRSQRSDIGDIKNSPGTGTGYGREAHSVRTGVSTSVSTLNIRSDPQARIF